MRAFGWAVAIIFGGAVVAGIIVGLTGWDSERVYGGVMGVAICALCERTFGDDRRRS